MVDFVVHELSFCSQHHPLLQIGNETVYIYSVFPLCHHFCHLHDFAVSAIEQIKRFWLTTTWFSAGFMSPTNSHKLTTAWGLCWLTHLAFATAARGEWLCAKHLVFVFTIHKIYNAILRYKCCTGLQLNESALYNNIKSPFMDACFDIYVTDMTIKDLINQIGMEFVVCTTVCGSKQPFCIIQVI